VVIPFRLVAAVTSATPPQANPTATTANGRVSVFVSELHADEASALFSPALTDLLANEVARFQGVEVISAGDVKALLNAEATKQLLGCSDDDCFVDIARMLNTTYLLHGTVHRFEGSTQVTINVVDAEAGRSVSRAQQILGAGDP